MTGVSQQRPRPSASLNHVVDAFGDPERVTIFDPDTCDEGEVWITVDAAHALSGARGDFA